MASAVKAKKRKAKPTYEAETEELAPDTEAQETKDSAGSGDDEVPEKLLETARAQYKRGWQREQRNIEEAYDDLNFLDGKQWDDDLAAQREAEDRPCLRLNLLPQFVRQVTGDMRLNRKGINIVAVDNKATAEGAKLYREMIRYIENRSDAQAAYMNGADQQVAAGIGHWRVVSEYADPGTFNQELRILPIDDGISVIWDAESTMLTREDAKHCFVPVDMPKDVFKEKYPGKSHSELGDGDHAYAEGWVGEDYVRVSEYFVKKPKTKVLALMPNGAVDDVTDEPPERVEELKTMGIRVEERESFIVCRYLITLTDVLEGPDELPISYIPVVPVVGEEIKIGRKVSRRGVVRNAKDAQRLYNYYESADAEVTALQPKAPFKATKKNVEKYRSMWENANRTNQSVLIYEPDAANGGAAPQREAPPQGSAAIQAGILRAGDDMKRIIGIYDAGLGARSNETSGKAILARQREGDIGTSVFADNLDRAKRHTAKILVDWIPHVYDTTRVIRIMGEDGTVNTVTINQPAILGGISQYLNDVTAGAYDVVAETGPSFSTRREESRDGMTEFMRAVPAAAPLLLDVMAENQDWPGKEKIAQRAKALLPPPIQQMEANEEHGGQPGAPAPGQPPQPGQAPQGAPQQQPNPQQVMAEQAAQHSMAAKAAAETATAKKAVADEEIASQKARGEKARADKAEAEAKIAEIDLHERTMHHVIAMHGAPPAQ